MLEIDDYIKKAHSYDPISGIITRTKEHPRYGYGKPVGTLNKAGYLRIKVKYKLFQYHRIAWLLHYGEWPENHIDHINGLRSDNRIENLRDTTCSENQKNRNCHRSGQLLGAIFNKSFNKWQATAPCYYKDIKIGNKRKYLGLFETELEAHKAVVVYCEKILYNKNR